MASLLGAGRPPRPRCFICRNYRHHVPGQFAGRRWIGQKYLTKMIEADLDWQKQAREIRAGERTGIFQVLEERGFIHQVTGSREQLEELLTSKRTGAYVGIDPTASSMHIGHILPFMVTFWMYLHGIKAISVIGGSTAQIGDPTDRLDARQAMSPAVRKGNIVSIQQQLKRIWMNVERLGEKYGYKYEWAWRRGIANNNVWLNKTSVTEFMRLLGRGTRLGPMLGRDTVKNRMKKGDGMSFAEFSYPLLQAWDWWHLFHTQGLQIQIGGSDQFGNIVSGIDSINFIAKNHEDPETVKQHAQPLMQPMGLTVPLLTSSSGEKFGKSAGNAIWLDEHQTSSFDLYQYFMRVADTDVERYLKLLTFLPLPEIAQAVEEHGKDPPKRVAQHLLAKEFVSLVHGRSQAEQAEQQHKGIFGAEGVKAPVARLPWQEDSNMNVKLPRSAIVGVPFPRVLTNVGLVRSASEGHRLVAAQGAYAGARPNHPGDMSNDVSWTPIKTEDPRQTENYILEGDRLLLRHGKWKIRIVHILSDEEFARQGLEFPKYVSERAKVRAVSGSKKEMSDRPRKNDDDLQMPPAREKRDL